MKVAVITECDYYLKLHSYVSTLNMMIKKYF